MRNEKNVLAFFLEVFPQQKGFTPDCKEEKHLFLLKSWRLFLPLMTIGSGTENRRENRKRKGSGRGLLSIPPREKNGRSTVLEQLLETGRRSLTDCIKADMITVVF